MVGATGCGDDGPDFLRVSGRDFRHGDAEDIRLRGINFNNSIALGAYAPANIATINIVKSDYAEVGSWGTNSVRFGLSFDWWEQDRARFFRVLDRHVGWARDARLWLLLTLYVLPGSCYEGYQTSCPLWTSPGHQEALERFWTDVARHYADDPTVAGYDLVNEPTPPAGAEDVWPRVGQRLRDAIARVDPNHFVIFEALSNRRLTQPLRGENIVYSDHYYAPLTFTHGAGECRYPGPCDGRDWDREALRRDIADPGVTDVSFAARHHVPLLIGEFGTRKRPDYLRWASDVTDAFEAAGLHWSYFVMREGAPPEDPAASFGLYTCDGPGNRRCPDRALIAAQRRRARGSTRP